MLSVLSRAAQPRLRTSLLQPSLQTTHKTDHCLPDLHLSENLQSRRSQQQRWETSAGSMEMSIKMRQSHTQSQTKTTSGELCRWNMWLLDHRHNVERHQRLLPQHLRVLRGQEHVQEVKARWRFLQPSPRGESSQQRSHCLKILPEMLNIKADGHRAHANNKAWPLHPDPDENHL